MEAQTAAIDGHQEGAVLGLGATDGEETFPFAAAVNLGAMGLAADARQEPFHWIGGPVEDQVEEATEGADGLVEQRFRRFVPPSLAKRVPG